MKRMLIATCLFAVSAVLFSPWAAKGAEPAHAKPLSPEQAVMLAFSMIDDNTEVSTPTLPGVRLDFGNGSSAPVSSAASCGCPAGECTCPLCDCGLKLAPVDSDHTCPLCGKYVNTVNRESGGMHSHLCTHSGTRYRFNPATEWWHADPPSITAAVADPVPVADSAPAKAKAKGKISYQLCFGNRCENYTVDEGSPIPVGARNVRFYPAALPGAAAAVPKAATGVTLAAASDCASCQSGAVGASGGGPLRRLASGDRPVLKIVTAPLRIIGKLLGGRRAGAGGGCCGG